MGREKPTSARRLTKRDHQARALELKAGGMSTPDIAHTLGVHRGTVWTWIREGLAETVAAVHENAGTYRAIQHERIEAAIGAVMPEVLQGNLGAVDRLVKLLARESSLMGLDLREPDTTEQHLHIHSTPEVMEYDREIADLLRKRAMLSRGEVIEGEVAE
ncbi:MAG: helix-turn-helix domain-containing protein [Thermoleophilia bacterium]